MTEKCYCQFNCSSEEAALGFSKDWGGEGVQYCEEHKAWHVKYNGSLAFMLKPEYRLYPNDNKITNECKYLDMLAE